MGSDRNIWSASLLVANKNYIYFVTYCLSLTLIMVIDEYFSSNSARTISIVFASVILAIPPHLSALSQLPASEAMRELQLKDPRYIGRFGFRTIMLGLISITPMFILIFFLLDMMDRNSAILVTILLALLFAALIFAKWGTMLPAIVMQGDRTFSTAGKRGTISFYYAFPRLLLSFGLLTILQIAFVTILVVLLGAGDEFFPEAGGFNFALLLPTFVGAIVGGYQVVLTSVILSRAYLRAENATNHSDLVLA